MKKIKFPKFKSSNPKTQRKKGTLITVLSIIVSGIVIASLAGTAIATLIITDILKGTPTLDVQDFISPDSTKIYAADGELIADIGYHLRENITYEQMPQSLIDAFVAVEDSRYFVHNGFDLPRFAKALIENVAAGEFEQGGSTFTMQLVKNTYYVTEEQLAPRSLDRKFQEISLAMQLEKELSKKRILELYLNKINFGAPNSLGIQTAAQYYFGKDVENLNLAESAFLAGVINAPNGNNPYYNLESGTRRRNVVLDLMVRHGYISKEESKQTKSIKLEDLLIGNQKVIGEASPYQAYIDAVVEEVVELTGQDPYIVPMEIYTHMNQDMQTAGEAIANGETSINFGHDLLDMASVTMDHTTGEIIAMVGGRNYTGQRVWNIATNSYNQMGSAIKPVLSYALGFEYLGLSTSHIIRDEPTIYRGTNIVIANFDRRYLGDVPLEVALTTSRNIPAVKLLQDVVDTVGVARVVEYLNSIGFPRVTTSNFGIGHALGSFEASVNEVNGAFGMLLNQGVYIQPHTVARIEFKDGTQPIVPSYASTRTLSAEAAYLASHFMERAVSGGYANFMGMLNRGYPVYAKTGTTDWGKEGRDYGIPDGAAKEYWIVGGTSKYINSVWIGFDKAIKGEKTYITSDIRNRNLRGNIMKLLLDKQGEIESNKFKPIPRPSGIANITHILGTYPYANVITGMDPSLITSGMIKSDFANLTSLTVENPERLESMATSLSITSNTNTVTVELPAYPNPEQLTVAPRTLKMEVRTGNKVVSATGTRMFDPSWIYGPVRYVARVKANNNVYTEISAERTFQVAFTGGLSTNIEVCGFYAYEKNLDARSNEVCETVELSSATITVPTFANLTSFNAWASAFGLSNITMTPLVPNKLEDVAKVDKVILNNTKNIINTLVPVATLKSGTLNVHHYEDRKVDLTSLIGKPKSTTKDYVTYPDYQFLEFNSTGGSQGNWIISDIQQNGQRIRLVQLIKKTKLDLILINPNATP